MAEVTWIRVLIEAPSAGFESTSRFWAAVCGAEPAPGTGDDVVLVPASASPFVRLRPTDRLRWSVSLVLEADDPVELAERALETGARRAGGDGFRSPGDFRFDIVPAGSSRTRPEPVLVDGARSRLDQVCIDCPPRVFAAEVEFWAGLTGWDVRQGGLPEFAWLVASDQIPVRIVFQELGAGHRGRRARAHLDVACGGDVGALVGIHGRLGATRGSRGRVWHTMSDPSGLSYCLTERDPISGTIERPL